VASTISSQLDSIQNKTYGIGNIMNFSLGQHKLLLDDQSIALQGLDTLTQTQVEEFE